ncbi:DUF423 domain-containing protein [Chitinimonas sp. BJYL2]|uniref:DUF423 domain-containing protein n=1 Tax=Chitinimonas sp. BJYL2 TaxID=2976696 RepID=UPI0022B3C705|nr:DUF423 domain-containing protein [Chitinimonas sp. BJYL2]
MNRPLILFAALGGFSGVALGAFAAHGLKHSLPPDMLPVFQTGTHYQLLHSLALLALGLAGSPLGKYGHWAGHAFAAGIVLFSGSLYLLALTGIRPLGAITPLGGLAFLAGWACLALAGWRHRADGN